ncbi:hypothetical protein [Streptomyces sp. MNP-20]|uniref:hypothetical protein n=1 Tax=Streptomyces sp. MNP-20 TaxID=2721165 RepID=UPI00155709E9|nr:hypothetical protein [Streptomyces sp. MNP-20]
MTRTYGHIWADWLYGGDKDRFMVSVYDACREIDGCASPAMKARLIADLRARVSGSSRAWVEGIHDFLDFESRRLSHGSALVEVPEDGEEYRVLAALDAAYRHGAFRGLCRTPGGAEWIGRLGEFCAAAVHQGFKWVRVDGGADEWELPVLGEAWCKGAALWGLVSLYVAVDRAAVDPDNDAVLARVHGVIGAHHMAGATWLAYRGAHPHKPWSAVRGRAPGGNAVAAFGREHGWPEEMTDVLVRGAEHVNTWVNPAVDPVHLERTRGLLIGGHVPRLEARVARLSAELADLAGGVSAGESAEIMWRASNWMSTYTGAWSGRGDDRDRVLELTAIGAVTGALRESRPHLTAEFVDRAERWARERTAHLPQRWQELLVPLVRTTAEVRGRVPGTFEGISSEGVGPKRFLDGVWTLSQWAILAPMGGGREFPGDLVDPTIRFFNALTQRRRIEGTDFPVGGDDHGGCWVCLGSSLFTGLVDNRPENKVQENLVWSALTYNNLGLGEVDDPSLGSS